MEKCHRISCKSNLIQLGASLAMYADDNVYYPENYAARKALVTYTKGDKLYPDKNDAAGLETMRCYQPFYSSYMCPSRERHVRKGKDSEPLDNNIISYRYRGGQKLCPKNKDHTAVPIAWDKAGNHKDFGNVLYSNGQVKSLSGAQWHKHLENMRKLGFKRQ